MFKDNVIATKEFIDKNFSHIESIEKIAQEIGCDYHSLRVEFVRKYGMTMTNYLNFVRCQNAKRYLRNTD